MGDWEMGSLALCYSDGGRQADSVEDEVQKRLLVVRGGQAEKLSEKERNELRKRKLLSEV